MRTEKRLKPKSALIAAALCLVVVSGPSLSVGHVGDPLLPEECGSCHVGHGLPGQPMLALEEEEFCFQCHGSDDKRTAMVTSGRLSPAARPADMEKEFQKPFRHPVAEGSGHSPTERLPSFSGAPVGHAECVDCHDPHQLRAPGRPQTNGVTGYSLTGQHLETSVYEYEMCLKCHAEYVGLDRSERSLSVEFGSRARSQHPVTRFPRGEKLPSLSDANTQGTMMRCSDCHTNDDPSGPRGPHGSNHPFLLSGNYDQAPVARESAIAYQFCYSCHERASILDNESFPLHREHIEGDPFTGRLGTSCYTCHASHGSEDYPHLLRFSPGAVSRDGTTGLMRFEQTGTRSGRCWLSCHGVDHGPKEY